MASMPLAFSIHNFISSVGADAGFAAIIGLAVLVLLYFAHARETANLREEASLLTQRLMQAEARVAQLNREQTAPAPATSTPVAVPSPAAASFPFAPAGVGAPALAAATRVVPLALPVSASTAAAPQPQRPGPQPAQPPAPAVAAAAPVARAAPPFERDRPASAPIAAPSAATVAGANGHGHDDAVAAPPPPSDGGLPPLPPRSRPGTPPGAGPLPPLREPTRGRSRFGRGAAALVGAALIAGVAAVLIIATSSGTTSSSSTTPRTTNTPAPRRSQATPPPFSPSSVTVAVLNGTNVNQLAHRVAAKLVQDGYKQGPLNTWSNQSEPTTVVAYFPSAANRTAALHVASALNLKPSAVQPIGSGTQQVACSGSSTCANVVVTVGADLATL